MRKVVDVHDSRQQSSFGHNEGKMKEKRQNCLLGEEENSKSWKVEDESPEVDE